MQIWGVECTLAVTGAGGPLRLEAVRPVALELQVAPERGQEPERKERPHEQNEEHPSPAHHAGAALPAVRALPRPPRRAPAEGGGRQRRTRS
eukprot:286280-Prorocentrum_minimum.AAC.2